MKVGSVQHIQGEISVSTIIRHGPFIKEIKPSACGSKATIVFMSQKTKQNTLSQTNLLNSPCIKIQINKLTNRNVKHSEKNFV